MVVPEAFFDSNVAEPNLGGRNRFVVGSSPTRGAQAQGRRPHRRERSLCERFRECNHEPVRFSGKKGPADPGKHSHLQKEPAISREIQGQLPGGRTVSQEDTEISALPLPAGHYAG